jgi:hypothetical protein
MNRQILKLTAPYFPRDTDGWIAASDEDIVKFAELIVQECAELAACNAHVSGFTLGDLIKKHFGIDHE